MWKLLKVTEVRDGKATVTEHAKPEPKSNNARRIISASESRPECPAPSKPDPRFRKYGPGGRASPFTD